MNLLKYYVRNSLTSPLLNRITIKEKTLRAEVRVRKKPLWRDALIHCRCVRSAKLTVALKKRLTKNMKFIHQMPTRCTTCDGITLEQTL